MLMSKEEPKKGNLRVWHIPQIPMTPFLVPVESADEALKILKVLAYYDIFQFENKVKPDYCNAQGLEEFDGEEWCEWYSEDGDDIRQYGENKNLEN